MLPPLLSRAEVSLLQGEHEGENQGDDSLDLEADHGQGFVGAREADGIGDLAQQYSRPSRSSYPHGLIRD